ncbi:MAG: TonB family protein [Sphingomonas sp.]|uniref:energy transducer TonB n=1 Tax=Sphingomonas sp. TaxID=28214 RepID=UPI001B2AE90A|nr:energy transducer TonB [Sphingomonas sp.]MBO9621975.1 TonB family protein [Sphingomonas sp.]
MYAEHRYQPRQSRSVSLGAAFAINGAVIAGMLLYLAPNFVPKTGGTIHVIDVKDPPEPPPVDQPKPEPEARPRTSQEPLIVAPDPLVRTETSNATKTTEVIPLEPPPTYLGTDADPKAEPFTPPLPVPPLIAASQDLRYARDFQPDYPASELRAQRDGVVRVRIRIGVDGRVKAVEQLSATSPAFFDATRRQALSKWRFKPATRGGVPEESWKEMSVRFELENQ